MFEATAARDDEGTRRRGGIRWERADAVAVARRDARRDAQRSRHSRTTRSGRPSDRARRAPRGIGGGRARSGAGREGGIWARGPFDARRTWRRTFATKRGSPLDATDFSSSATFAKSCREDRAGGGKGEGGEGTATVRHRRGGLDEACSGRGHVSDLERRGSARTTSRTSRGFAASSFFASVFLSSLSFISTSAPIAARGDGRGGSAPRCGAVRSHAKKRNEQTPLASVGVEILNRLDHRPR